MVFHKSKFELNIFLQTYMWLKIISENTSH